MKSSLAKKYAIKKAMESKTNCKTNRKGDTSPEIITPEYQNQVRDQAYLGNQGYTIPKSCLSKEDLLFLQKSLELEPKLEYGLTAKKTAFPVYRENDQKIYLPRFYGLKRYGEPKIHKMSSGETISVPFIKPIRDYQEKIIQVYFDHVSSSGSGSTNTNVLGGGGILEVPCGRGKCLAKDTLILMLDGSVRPVQDIQVGDILMGDDSKGREVLSLARGRETMYEVREIIGNGYGITYTVNNSHILSLKNKNNCVLDISIPRYIATPKHIKKDLYGYRVPIKFPEKFVDLNAYDIGYYSAKNKHLKIPSEYIINCKKIQLQLLAGIIDACGYYCNIRYIIPIKIEKYSTFFQDVLFLVRSLGFSILFHDSLDESGIEKVREIVIGENTIRKIPVKENKHLSFSQQTKEWIDETIEDIQDFLKYPIEIVEKEKDDYYGFEIDGNRRFVLGDFTVTHNTVMALKIISVLSKKTLILVHKEFLMNQWIERILEFMPSARVGKIQGPLFDIQEKDIVIGMIQSLYDRVFSLNAFSSFGLTVIDEVHRIGSEEFSKTLFKTITPYMLGISATVERKDGLTELLYMFIGPKIYSEERKDENVVEVRAVEFADNCEKYNKVEYDFKGDVLHSTMISKISNFEPRKHFLVRILRDLVAEHPEKQIMVLSQIRCLLTFLYDSLISHDLDVGYYVGGMKKEALIKSESCRIVLATYAMAAEALDIKTLNTLVMVSPKTDIIQSVGRILRTRADGKIIVDIVDTHEVFQNQWRKRRAYYKKCEYGIRFIKYGDYRDMSAAGGHETKSKAAGWKTLFQPRLSTICTSSKKKEDDDSSENENNETLEEEHICHIPITDDMLSDTDST